MEVRELLAELKVFKALTISGIGLNRTEVGEHARNWVVASQTYIDHVVEESIRWAEKYDRVAEHA